MNAIRLNSTLISGLLGIIFFSSCADDPLPNLLKSQNNTNHGLTGTGSLVFTQPDPLSTTPKVDILFVVDTSGSLHAELQYIANALSALVGTFPENADFRVAVMLAHIASQYSGSLYKRNSEDPAVLGPVSSSMTLPMIQNLLLQKMTNPPSESLSDGGEAGILSLTNGLTGDKFTANRAQGFFREDAGLSIIFVADENDLCFPGLVEDREYPRELNAYLNYCAPNNGSNLYTAANLHQKLLLAQGDRALTVSGVLYTGENGPVASVGEDELGLGYLDVIDLVDNGYKVDLTDPSPDSNGPGIPDPVRITAGLVEIGNFTTNSFYAPKLTFILEHSGVIAESIIVNVNGAVIPRTFLPETNAVRILEGDAGGPGAIVTITYQYNL